MPAPEAPSRRARSVHGWVSAALVGFGLLMVLAFTVQGFRSQYLIEHRYWVHLLQAVSADHAQRVRSGGAATLPHTGLVRSWYLPRGTVPANLPAYLATLPPGRYSTEDGYGEFQRREAFDGAPPFHALVVDLPGGRLVTQLDIAELEDQQNRDSLRSAGWVFLLGLLIVSVIVWLHANLARPVRDLARRMQAIEPGNPTARLPTDYRREEIQIIAQASNAHLERVAQFMERERSLLDQASHEFRTPIAVIAGALDLLRQQQLPGSAQPALGRIEHAVSDLSETMVALLYLAREPLPDDAPAEVVELHTLLPKVLDDHQHLLRSVATQLVLGTLEPTYIAAPEAMVRIAVSNLIRNAVENTPAGAIEVALRQGVVCVSDSGSGFDPVEAARRYRDSLRQLAPTRGQGLGLYLIGRICERFGWRLRIDPRTTGGTVAQLDVTASIIPL
ncbi:HAMP domain-containing sensor histidine kinase [Stenotrophomonas sp. 24(2023)]|uniref:sensor histidine kinase n=1 Tax=Stenotrophomonas sp. 24(2023) TaxID=3068324 RepID=UPI0027DF60F8|nr:HAMP domain-containing sensor histidine kinase [Stenotrophomonas sp. 24(2023)]WMJ68214.1 HAMP domain-containing sensor histidine kinase [Stenotrophomonas sp. 24(2023)]